MPQRDGKTRHRVNGVLRLFLDVREPLNRYSVAMQQIVAICRAIDLSAKVLISMNPPPAWIPRK
jgi:ABC-type sugar transport system ATPase subunit